MTPLHRLVKMLTRKAEPSSHSLRESEIEFVICVEGNRLEPQARLLCESLREFGGRYRNAPITALAPRAGLEPRARTIAHLESLGVRYVAAPLNRTGSPYGSINRIVTGAWAEAHSLKPYLVVLDTDTIFVAEPDFKRVDVGVRPVDRKGSASSGAALSIAIWSIASAVHIYDSRYNIPLNNLLDPAQEWKITQDGKPILLHYHHLAEVEFQPELRRILARIGCSPDVCAWIESRLPYFAQD